MNTKQKKALYESIMKSVAKTVKKALNESNGSYYVYTRVERDEWYDFTDAERAAYENPEKYSGPYVTKEEAMEEAKKAAIEYACELDTCGEAYEDAIYYEEFDRNTVTYEEFAYDHYVKSDNNSYWVTTECTVIYEVADESYADTVYYKPSTYEDDEDEF